MEGDSFIYGFVPHTTVAKETTPKAIQEDRTTPIVTTTTTTTTTTKRPLTDAELTKLAETRPITVLFVGDRSYSTISKEQFYIYGQSHLNVINAIAANSGFKLKMKVHSTYLMTDEQDKNHLKQRQDKSFDATDISSLTLLQDAVDEYHGGKEADMVFVLTSKRVMKKDNNVLYTSSSNSGVCGGKQKVLLIQSHPFTYETVVSIRSIVLNKATSASLQGCKTEFTACRLDRFLAKYKEDLNASLCHTTSETAKPPTFSGIVGFSLNKFCERKAIAANTSPVPISHVDSTCFSNCGISSGLYSLDFVVPCQALATPGQHCFDENDHLCFDRNCQKTYGEIRALSRRNWNLPDSAYNETGACASVP
ncbi:uncharacterized protein LOC135392954 [Ornithodoros turicata]|uniref:uncharacterized protein LOC135392954 n=1 Tax=Ornithodoros turicata TaxID=34597 RepID=UPI003139F1B3